MARSAGASEVTSVTVAGHLIGGSNQATLVSVTVACDAGVTSVSVLLRVFPLLVTEGPSGDDSTGCGTHTYTVAAKQEVPVPTDFPISACLRAFNGFCQGPEVPAVVIVDPPVYTLTVTPIAGSLKVTLKLVRTPALRIDGYQNQLTYGLGEPACSFQAPRTTMFTNTVQFTAVSFPPSGPLVIYQCGPSFWFTGWGDFEVRYAVARTDARPQPQPTNMSLIDPVPDLLLGPAITPRLDILATGGRVVSAVAADGVTKLVLRIPAAPGTVFTFRLLNDSGPAVASTSADEDGGLGAVDGVDATRSALQVTARDIGTGSSYAFAVYNAPSDFARQAGSGFKAGRCGAGAAQPDDLLSCRQVSLEVASTAGPTVTVPITILRAPVVLIHGLWSDWETWKGFAPLVTGPNSNDPRFYIGRIDYNLVGPLVAADPPLRDTDLAKVRGSALGLEANVPQVLGQMISWIESFKDGHNTQGVPAAAVQADVVTHSLGGLITRAMAYHPQFMTDDSFGRGPVHKLITIDTPHRGSPLAYRLLSPAARGGCLEGALDLIGNMVVRSVRVAGSGRQYSGAIADLAADDTVPAYSDAILGLQAPPPVSFPMAMIAGRTTDFGHVDHTGWAALIRNLPTCDRDPVAGSLTSTGWPQIFNGQSNDAIVSLPSQLDGREDFPYPVFSDYIHTDRLGLIGFVGEPVLRASPISEHVITLLNTPATRTPFPYSLGGAR